ncbi:hypothetical protein LRP49_14850 [Enterovibrio sp. ZSDZ35]|uniref:O-antigen ligase-related domain-containing protein n=1 Tax=Enterovibrio qingdaonensis TaxID=2899818 RepID=A0ABT5QP44_9GAMM|nr:O-antigen ligase family protein [Enterovibrio sp. ZSDZ35]MDD1782448.1 hypothetical protein [Enterovibrio sp. ZSDZ35]
MRTLAYILICSTPFWSLPLIPGTYSAVTPYFGALLGAIFIISKVRSFSYTSALVSIYFLFLLIIYSFYSYYIQQFNFAYTLAYFVGFLCFPGFYYAFNLIGREHLFNCLLKLSRLFSIVAIVEFFLSKTSMLHPLKIAITSFITGSDKAGFVLTTNEPSWAVQLLLFISVFIFLNYLENKNRFDVFLLFTNATIFMLVFSMTGFIVLVVSLSFYFIVFSKVSLGSLFKYSICILMSFFAVSIVYSFFNQGGYTFSRISNLAMINTDNIYDMYYMIIAIDNSLLIRIGYPVVGLNMIVDYPYGYGISGFSYNLHNYTDLVHSPIMYESELTRHLRDLNADPRNFIIRIGVDFGIAGLFLFLFVFSHQIRLAKSLFETSLLPALLLSLSFGVMMQFSTFYFFLYPFTYAFLLFLRDLKCQERKY